MHISTSLAPGSDDVGISATVTCPRSSTVILNDTRPLRPEPTQARSLPWAARTTFSLSARGRLPETLTPPPPEAAPTGFFAPPPSDASVAASVRSGAASLTTGAGGGGGGAAAGSNLGASLREQAMTATAARNNTGGESFFMSRIPRMLIGIPTSYARITAVNFATSQVQP